MARPDKEQTERLYKASEAHWKSRRGRNALPMIEGGAIGVSHPRTSCCCKTANGQEWPYITVSAVWYIPLLALWSGEMAILD